MKNKNISKVFSEAIRNNPKFETSGIPLTNGTGFLLPQNPFQKKKGKVST